MLQNLCRICAKPVRNKISKKLFEESTQEILINIKAITGLMLAQQPGLPEFICDCCELDLQQAILFRDRCIQIQEYLLQEAIKEEEFVELETIEEGDVHLTEVDEDVYPVKLALGDESELTATDTKDNDIVDEFDEDLNNLDAVLSNDHNINQTNNNLPHHSGVIDVDLNDSKDIHEVNICVGEEIDINRLDAPLTSANDENLSQNIDLDPDDDDADSIDSIPASIHDDSEKECKDVVVVPVKPKTTKNPAIERKLALINKKVARAEALQSKKATHKGAATAKSKKVGRKSINDKLPENTKAQWFICDQCGIGVFRRHAFEQHLRRHFGVKEHQCELCTDSFCTQSELKRHMRKHTGERPFACHYCERRFTDYSTRVKHERTHTNERPYLCNECGKSFTTAYILKNHMLIHTGERSFRCDICRKSFQRQTHLATHFRSIVHKQNEENVSKGGHISEELH